ncbi:MAG TPA: RusA family crossover junction endodeoxyribonuclease [Nitrospirales bacterium]|nr:RusA family crossover junction endodeoxyribonuclease [Nitrospirales bacterium]
MQHSIQQLLLASGVKRARRRALSPVNSPASPWPARHSVADHPENGLRLLLPLPPSINHQYATVQGRRVLSSAGRRFKTLVGQEVLCTLAKRKSGHPLGQMQDGTPLALDLLFYFESKLRRDIDGGLKITQDAVCEALGINDNRIVEVTLRKELDAAAPRLELSLHLCSHPAP